MQIPVGFNTTDFWTNYYKEKQISTLKSCCLTLIELQFVFGEYDGTTEFNLVYTYGTFDYKTIENTEWWLTGTYGEVVDRVGDEILRRYGKSVTSGSLFY